MRTLLILAVLALPIGALAWWRHPCDRVPEVAVFDDGGAALRREVLLHPAWPQGMAMRWAGMRRMFPGWIALATVALTGGLFIRQRRSYASPTLAWLGKRTAFSSPVCMALFVAAPVTTGWALPLSAGAAGLLGMILYVANLPKRL